MKWAEGPMLGFDTESTGIDVWTDRIVTASLVDIRPARRPASTTWLVNPGVEIPAEATAVHGITTEHAREHGRDPGPALFEVTASLALTMGKGIPVVGANLAYDLTLLEVENERHGNPTLRQRLHPKRIGPCVDVMVLDRYVDKYRKGGRKLSDLVTHYGVILAGAHTADADALAACRLFPRILAKSRELQGYPLGALHQLQIKARAEQMDGLRKYFDKNGTPHDGCNGGWPLRTDRPVEVAS